MSKLDYFKQKAQYHEQKLVYLWGFGDEKLDQLRYQQQKLAYCQRRIEELEEEANV